MMEFLQYITPTCVFPIALLAAVAVFVVYYVYAMRPRMGSLEWMTGANRPARVSFSARLHPMERKDALPVLLLTIGYAAVAFCNLGSMSTPQNWQSFQTGDEVDLTLPRQVQVSRISYYTGIGCGSFQVELSEDGVHYTPFAVLDQSYNKILKWQEALPDNAEEDRGTDGWSAPEARSARYVRISCLGVTSSQTDPYLGEIALYDEAGERMTLTGVRATGTVDATPLLDEQETVPELFSWKNSAVFDEIYHPRTAYEHIIGATPYEISHPPLGKLIMSLGIRMFGMTPFGYRFMGTLFGVLMLPILYVFLKNLFGKTCVAVCGTLLFAFDFMHFTQTRLATIDTYGVFFILLLYFFLYRWMCQAPGTPFRRSVLPLLLGGLSFGLGCASKWTVVYAGVGAGLLYLLNLYTKSKEWNGPGFGAWAARCIGFSILTFVVIPVAIYTASYIPYAAAAGDVTVQSVVSEMLDNQKYMFTYHSGVNTPHNYESRWYQWILDIRPILYFRDMDTYAAEGLKSAYAAMGSPLVCWLGLACLGIAAVQMFRQRSGKALFLVTGYCSQLLPWMLITRTTFAYHYFPSILFLVLLICDVINDLEDRRAGKWRLAVYGPAVLNTVLFVMFYPVLMGLFVPTWYTTNILRWFPSWPF